MINVQSLSVFIYCSCRDLYLALVVFKMMTTHTFDKYLTHSPLVVFQTITTRILDRYLTHRSSQRPPKLVYLDRTGDIPPRRKIPTQVSFAILLPAGGYCMTLTKLRKCPTQVSFVNLMAAGGPTMVVSCCKTDFYATKSLFYLPQLRSKLSQN